MYLCGNFILSDFCLSLFSFFLILSNIYCSTTILLVENFDVELTDKPVKVYYFQVEDFHTYLVGGFGVLVHNADDTYSRLRKVSPDAKAKKAVNSVDGKKN